MIKRKNLVVFLTVLSAVVLLMTSVQPISKVNAAKKSPKLNKLEVDEFFTNIDGTFVLRDMKNDKTFVYNKERANQRFAPQYSDPLPTES